MDCGWSEVRAVSERSSRPRLPRFSAYCGGLHIAALRACVEMARIMGDTDAFDEYDVWLKLAKKSYSEKLWNGQL